MFPFLQAIYLRFFRSLHSFRIFSRIRSMRLHVALSSRLMFAVSHASTRLQWSSSARAARTALMPDVSGALGLGSMREPCVCTLRLALSASGRAATMPSSTPLAATRRLRMAHTGHMPISSTRVLHVAQWSHQTSVDRWYRKGGTSTPERLSSAALLRTD